MSVLLAERREHRVREPPNVTRLLDDSVEAGPSSPSPPSR
jgi:hypothetical protein